MFPNQEALDFQAPHRDTNNLERAGLAGRLRWRNGLMYDNGIGWERLLPSISVKDYGAKGDGTTDDTTAINAASAAVNTITNGTYAQGATLFFPAGEYLVTSALTPPKSNVRWMGAGGAVWSTSNPSASVIKTTLTGAALLDLGSTNNSNITIENLGFHGAGGINPLSHCIYGASVPLIRIKGCQFSNWGGCAIKILNGTGKWLENVEVTNTLLGYASLVAQTGSVHLEGSENNLYECNLNGPAFSLSTHGSYGSGYAAALYINGAPNTLHKCVAAFAQVGVYFDTNVTASPTFITDSRAEFNQGHGWVINGNRILFANCQAFHNSQDTDNTYDGFSNAYYLNSFVNCIVEGNSGATYQQRYAFTDASNTTANNALNNHRYTNCRAGYQVRGRTFNFTGAVKPAVSALQFVQALAGTGNQTFDGEKGDTFMLTVNANTTTTVKTTNLLHGHDYKLIVLNSSGATPSITLDTNFKVYGYAAPANGKYRYITLSCYDGTNLIGNASGDI